MRRSRQDFRLTDAQRDLAGQHYPLVWRLARDFIRSIARRPIQVPDHVISGGMLGLCRAAHLWDRSSGVPFETYAAKKILFGFRDAIRDDRPLGIPREWRAILAGKARSEFHKRHEGQIRAAAGTRSIESPDVRHDAIQVPDRASAPGQASRDPRLSITADAMEYLRDAYPIGHRVLCLTYGLEGYPAMDRPRISQAISATPAYVGQIVYWSMKLIRRYLASVQAQPAAT